MANAKEKVLSLLGSAVAGMQAADTKTTVYTVPVGKIAIIDHFVVRSPSASLNATSTGDFNFGSGAQCTSFREAVDLDAMTAVTDYMHIAGADVTKRTHEVAGNTLGVLPHASNGAVADVTATVEVWGHEFDA
jgi:hypothetical protein